MGEDPNVSDQREAGGYSILLVAAVLLVILAYGIALMILD
ncbi:hypothetical protein MOX02_02650 [Methylobacterium oxalidis]|uniref:Uncharacterized protein n=1 Tax=Methylobacterium oxalidis TaxID=944322 RepID=A0A512IWY1_9HYPH|nr:hypothetical protein MOX02_02650 [Methylobacterium oxalidis]GJE32219.1 hypothetical protein LDDCCGHA_2403 [Methylobacterium oxalidis]GLS62172.1 hypothetical protein GCM10007888_05530 [Methylobacterium oxalidis]